MNDITLLFLLLALGMFILVMVLRDKASMPLRFTGLIFAVGDLAFTLTDTTLPEIEYAVEIMVIVAFAMIVYHLWEIIDSITGKR